jgi:hypothetical protein
VTIGAGDFPGVGAAGEESFYTALQSGVRYELQVVSDQPGAADLDYLDVRLDQNARIKVQSLDPAFFDDRLQFAYMADKRDAGYNGRILPDVEDKSSGVVRITNTGTEPLDINDATLTGPFVLENPSILDGLSLAAGASIDVRVLFDPTQYTPPTGTNREIDAVSTIFKGALTLSTNDAVDTTTVIDLAGFWQKESEDGFEPNLNEMFEVFGFGNRIEGLGLRRAGELTALSNNDIYEKINETEILSPYWRIAEGHTTATFTVLATYKGPGRAGYGIHGPGDKSGGNSSIFLSTADSDFQTILPNRASSNPAINNIAFATLTRTNNNIPDAWVGDDVFALRIEGYSTDPRLNSRGPVFVPDVQQGHWVRVFQALDENGVIIPNVYIAVQDYAGINYDYNDNVLLIEGIEPIGFGALIDVAGLTDAAADDRLVFSNIDTPNQSAAVQAVGGQVFTNETVITLSNDGFIPLTISSMAINGPDAASFQIVGAPTSIVAGGSANVTVRFVGTDAATDGAATAHRATLTIASNGYEAGVKVIELAGLAQNVSEGGEEPTLAQIVDAFGYTTDVAQGLLNNGGTVETVGDEVLMPYLSALDPTTAVRVIQLAGFQQAPNVERLGFHSLASGQTTPLFAQDDQQSQTVSPDGLASGAGDTGSTARASFTPNGAFGLHLTVDGLPSFAAWTDPEANALDLTIAEFVGAGQGHLFRFFEAKNGAGEVIEGAYIAASDHPGEGDFDYNDLVFLISNVKPHALTAAEDANGDGVNDALQRDLDGNGTVDFFDWHIA